VRSAFGERTGRPAPPRAQAANRDRACEPEEGLRVLGETLARTLTGLASRIAAKVTAYTYSFLVNRKLGRPQGRVKELWA
jgi:hypothetical protein